MEMQKGEACVDAAAAAAAAAAAHILHLCSHDDDVFQEVDGLRRKSAAAARSDE